MAEASDNSCSSEDDEYSDPLAAAVKKILLVQPSSASAERGFSLLQNAFSKQQEAALEETVETSVMLRYNDNKRTWNHEFCVGRGVAGGAKPSGTV